jgi:DNA-binding NtrC family response regulator
VAETRNQVRILAIVASEAQSELERQLNSLDMSPVFIHHTAQLRQYVHHDEIYQVALLPAALPEELDWWTLWGELGLLTLRPAILVYAQAATFQLWSGVLEAGGYDVVVEPFTRDKLREAVLRAAMSFEQQHDLDGGEDRLDPD